ncbi:MAG: hypothetical protein IJN44_01910 [Clostridia bacterium]|nr:hypothetical protein [Clostridia bacterium]
MKVEETKKQHHGHNENDKNSGWENVFSHRLFFRFPRMLCIRLAAFRRRPVVRQCRSQLAIFQFAFAKGFCVFLGGKTAIPQALRACSLYTREPFSHVSAGLSCSSGKLFVR